MKLINEQIVSDPKELDPSWPNSLEWKLSIYDTLVIEISIMLKRYLDMLVEIKGNCHDLKVEITDEFDERILDSKEICLKFKEIFNKEMVDPITTTKESFLKLSGL